jgi:fructosamine-3-kinase
MKTWQAIALHVGEATGETFVPGPPQSVSGGCINEAFLLTAGHRRFFVKTNRAASKDMFDAEASGLEALHASATFHVPEPVCTGCVDGIAYIVMGYIKPGRPTPSGWRRAGERLAAMHRRVADQHGWKRDNTIGSTPQHNRQSPDWIEFWCRERLGFQLQEAARNGYSGNLQSSGERLLSRCDALIGHSPAPSLLHGDLWSGNIAFDETGSPIIFDPAVYFGDRETDLAMTELFGGFSPDFHAAYRECWPLEHGYEIRKTLYNLYHILNHLNLFGGGYAEQAQHMIDRLLAEC